MATAISRKMLVQAGMPQLKSRGWDWARQVPGLLKNCSNEDLHSTDQPEANMAVHHLHLNRHRAVSDSGRSNQEENLSVSDLREVQQCWLLLLTKAKMMWKRSNDGVKCLVFPTDQGGFSFLQRSLLYHIITGSDLFPQPQALLSYIAPEGKWMTPHFKDADTKEQKPLFPWLLGLKGINPWSGSVWVWADTPPQPNFQT